jgi:phosphatidylglycerophosphate synthase
MKLHRTSGKPDWENLTITAMNDWQRLAQRTGGVITPANAITVIGLVLVIIGLLLVAQKHYTAGLVIVIVGRLCDVLDGTIAERTHTKSPLGEALDAGFDKLASLAALWTLATTHIVPWGVAIVILVPNVLNAALTVLAKRRGTDLHPSKYGKLFMAYSWASLFGFVLVVALGHTLHTPLLILSYLLLAVCLFLATKAAHDYWPK